MKAKPDVVCIQESWLNPRLDLVFKGYKCEKRQGRRKRCITFLKEGMPYRVLEKEVTLEYIFVEIWYGNKNYVIINFYNPCKRLTQ